MEIKLSGMNDIQVCQTEGEREFRKLYRELRKKYGLRMHLHDNIYKKKDKVIEIWRDRDGRAAETVCRIREKDIEDCYRKAVIDLKHYDAKKMAAKQCGPA